MKTISCCVIAGLLAATPAMAEDFVGPRVEGIIGWDQQRYGESFDLGAVNRNASLGYGFALGYDTAFGNGIIAGVEGGVVFADSGFKFDNGTTSGEFRPRRDLELSVRAGLKVADRALVYGKIGYTNLELRQTVSAADVTTTNTTKLDGLRLGVGIEVPITANSYIKTEYRFSDYEKDFKKNDLMTGFGIRF